jgi:GAF domain-containing protein
VTDESIKRATAALDQEHTVRGLLETACRELVDNLNAKACAISRVVGDLLIALAEFSRGQHPLELGHEYLISDYPLTQEVIVTCESRAVSLLDVDPDPKEAALLAELGFESLLMVPVFVSGECWGLLEVYRVAGRRFDAADARRAEEIVGRTAARLAAAR